MATVDAIKKLHTSMIDTRRAYEKAQGEAEEPALKTFFGEMATLRHHAHDQLHRVLTDMGERPDESGSFMTNVHRTVIAVRAAVTGVDRGSEMGRRGKPSSTQWPLSWRAARPVIVPHAHLVRRRHLPVAAGADPRRDDAAPRQSTASIVLIIVRAALLAAMMIGAYAVRGCQGGR